MIWNAALNPERLSPHGVLVSLLKTMYKVGGHMHSVWNWMLTGNYTREAYGHEKEFTEIVGAVYFRACRTLKQAVYLFLQI